MPVRQTINFHWIRFAVVLCVGMLIGVYCAAGAQTPSGSSSSRDNMPADGDSGNDAAPQSNHSSYHGNYFDRNDKFSVDHFVFEGGGGFSVPTGGARQFENTGWNLKLGEGYKFNRHFAVMLDYDYVSLGIPVGIIDVVNPGGNGATHLWSLTVNPMFSYKIAGRWGGYAVGGGGFFRKVANFNQPVFSWCAYSDYYGDCYPGVANLTVAHFSNNAGGLDFGTGLTYRLTDSGKAQLFVEGRYVWVDNQASANNTAATGYPPANYPTEYIPITFGFRF